MSRCKTIISLAVLCALAMAAFSAPAASAASKAFTCVKEKGTLNSDCTHASSGSFGHVAVAEGTRTELTGTGGEAIMTGEILFLEEVLTATHVDMVRGYIENTATDASGKVELRYTGVTDSLGCGVTEEMVTTETLNFTTLANGEVQLTAPLGVFAEIHTGCGEIPVSGGITAQTNGAILSTTEADAGLFLGENPATLEGSLTISAGEEGVHHPIGLTEPAGPAFTCVEGKGTTNGDCKRGSSGKFGHVGIAKGKETELTGTGGRARMAGEILSVPEELEAEHVDVTRGTIVNNATDASGKVELTYTEVTDSLGCGVTEEMVTTSTLEFTTLASGEVQFTAPGGVFATIHTGCGNFNVKGGITAQTNGAILFTTATDAGLELGGNPATLEGSATISAGKTGEEHHPLSLT
jgi:hypothetical protein